MSTLRTCAYGSQNHLPIKHEASTFVLQQKHILLIPCGKFGPSYLGKATAAARAALPSPTVHAGSFHVSEIHRTLTWTTRPLKHAYVIILMHV